MWAGERDSWVASTDSLPWYFHTWKTLRLLGCSSSTQPEAIVAHIKHTQQEEQITFEFLSTLHLILKSLLSNQRPEGENKLPVLSSSPASHHGSWSQDEGGEPELIKASWPASLSFTPHTSSHPFDDHSTQDSRYEERWKSTYIKYITRFFLKLYMIHNSVIASKWRVELNLNYPYTSCVLFGILFNLSVFQFPYL